MTGNPDWTAAAPTVHATMPAGYEAYESLLLLAAIYLLRNVLFGMGAGDDPKYFAARSDADCGKLTLLWTCLMSLRWPMMMGIAVLGLAVVHQLFPDAQRAAAGGRDRATALPMRTATGRRSTADIAHDPGRAAAGARRRAASNCSATIGRPSCYSSASTARSTPSGSCRRCCCTRFRRGFAA